LNVAGTGFDAAVGAAFQRAGGRGGRRGLLGYLRLSLAEVLAYRPQPLLLEANAEHRSFKPLMITFANGPQYGSGAVINPGGRLDDGRLEVVSFEYDGSIFGLLGAAPRLFLGGINKVRRYHRLSTARAVVTAESPLQIHRDGDPVESARHIDVELVPRALDVIVPAATVADPAGPLTRS
jgi:diacylglycerol kinase family enzyme